jgi:hypothetical protein
VGMLHSQPVYSKMNIHLQVPLLKPSAGWGSRAAARVQRQQARSG